MLCYLSDAVVVHSNSKCIDHEREALLRFKDGITSDRCRVLSSWVEQEDCCQWRGVSCNNLTGHVIMLDLHVQDFDHMRYFYVPDDSLCQLKGQFGSSLFELKHLNYLDLSLNDFHHQSIPNSIDSLTKLEYLNLSHTGFVGEIPPHLGNLSKLAFLDLTYLPGYNYVLFAKSLQWLSRLTMLREIHLNGNNLSEATDLFNTITKMPSLSVLNLTGCELPPIVPSSLSYINASTSLLHISMSSCGYNDTHIFDWLFSLSKHDNQFEFLDLSWNNFAGPIPSAFGDMHTLSYLDLSSNHFEGPIPDNFSNLNKSLRYLSLLKNNFHGLFPKSFGNLCNLQELYLGYNSFADEFSNVLQTLSSGCANKPILNSLDLSWNQFWGSVPDIINTFSSMRELYLGGNKLNGTISQGIWQLNMLETLHVASCSLNVTLNHTHFLNLSRLSHLTLSDNPDLVINVSADWVPPFQLVTISLRSCNLGPDFPKWILTQKNIFELDISNSQISDVIPSAFGTVFMSEIHYLNVSHNKIRGVLPNLSITSNYETIIDLSSNCFEGSIPSFLSVNTQYLYIRENKFSDATDFLCSKTQYNKVITLDLSNNLLFGELPDCWLKFQTLNRLHLENNKFSGSIPASISTLRQLRYLYLKNNSFSGQLSALFCESLIVLDLGYNSLTGNIPSSIGNAFPDLRVLILRKNNFFGSLPSSFCQLFNLRVLDLAMNHISGIIPKCIYNLTAMGDTHDSDAIAHPPDRYVLINGRVYKIIQTYEETASIMWKREEQSFRSDTLMQLVKSIDLSHNELEGNIPHGISQLTGLISLDLSSNNLSGGIPSNIGQLTLLDFLDLSNNHLSGGIPISLAGVSRMGILNLSYNNLSGKIPLSTQLQGFDPSSYMGNPLLCGAPLHDCAHNGENIIPKNDHGNGDFYLGLYISVVLGFIIGFWGVCGSLVVKSSWRHAFFRYFDAMKDKIYVMVVVSVSKVWKKP